MTTYETKTIHASVAGSVANDHGCPRNPMLDQSFTGLIINLEYTGGLVTALKETWLTAWDAACYDNH